MENHRFVYNYVYSGKNQDNSKSPTCLQGHCSHYPDVIRWACLHDVTFYNSVINYLPNTVLRIIIMYVDKLKE